MSEISSPEVSIQVVSSNDSAGQVTNDQVNVVVAPARTDLLPVPIPPPIYVNDILGFAWNIDRRLEIIGQNFVDNLGASYDTNLIIIINDDASSLEPIDNGTQAYDTSERAVINAPIELDRKIAFSIWREAWPYTYDGGFENAVQLNAGWMTGNMSHSYAGGGLIVGYNVQAVTNVQLFRDDLELRIYGRNFGNAPTPFIGGTQFTFTRPGEQDFVITLAGFDGQWVSENEVRYDILEALRPDINNIWPINTTENIGLTITGPNDMPWDLGGPRGTLWSRQRDTPVDSVTGRAVGISIKEDTGGTIVNSNLYGVANWTFNNISSGIFTHSATAVWVGAFSDLLTYDAFIPDGNGTIYEMEAAAGIQPALAKLPKYLQFEVLLNEYPGRVIFRAFDINDNILGNVELRGTPLMHEVLVIPLTYQGSPVHKVRMYVEQAQQLPLIYAIDMIEYIN